MIAPLPDLCLVSRESRKRMLRQHLRIGIYRVVYKSTILEKTRVGLDGPNQILAARAFSLDDQFHKIGAAVSIEVYERPSDYI
jgi:hypothetical protein